MPGTNPYTVLLYSFICVSVCLSEWQPLLFTRDNIYIRDNPAPPLVTIPPHIIRSSRLILSGEKTGSGRYESEITRWASPKGLNRKRSPLRGSQVVFWCSPRCRLGSFFIFVFSSSLQVVPGHCWAVRKVWEERAKIRPPLSGEIQCVSRLQGEVSNIF